MDLSKTQLNFLLTKSNHSNINSKLLNEDVDLVEKLNFQDPSIMNQHKTKDNFYNYKRMRKVSKEKIITGETGVLRRSAVLPTIATITTEPSTTHCNKENNLEKLENFAFETKLNQLKKAISENLSEKKAERKRYINMICLLNKEEGELKIDIDFLQNFHSYQNSQSEIAEFIQTKKKVSSNGLKMNKDQNFQLISKIQKAARMRDEELAYKKSQLNRKIEGRKMLKHKVEDLDIQINFIKKELQVTEESLFQHYHSVLKEGSDCRQSGLTWIIKEIFQLGPQYKVQMSNMPSFLDEECVKYLFDYCRLDMDVLKINSQKMIYKEMLRKKKEMNFEMFKTRKTFKTDLERSTVKKISSRSGILIKTEPNLENDKKNLKLLKHKHVKEGKSPRRNPLRIDYNLNPPSDILEKYKEETYQDSDIFTMKAVTEYLDTKQDLDKETNELINFIDNLEKKEIALRGKMEKIKRKELDRLFKEFLSNDYERRFNTNKAEVLNALVGEDECNQEMSKQLRDYKQYMEKLRACRTFNIMESITMKNEYQNEKKIHKSKGGSGDYHYLNTHI
jgi:hypothetical protein